MQKKQQHVIHYVFKIIETLTNVFLHVSFSECGKVRLQCFATVRKAQKRKRGNISPGGELFSVTHFYIFCSEEMYNYHPKFCYGTQTTHGQKVYFLYPFFKYFPLIPRFRLFRISSSRFRIFRIFRVSKYSIFSCFRIFRVFRNSAIPFHHSTA